MQYVQLAEQHALQTPNTANPAELSEIYVATGQALSTIGDQKGAMDRFSKALSTPHSDRVAVRLAIAHVMAQQNHTEDAERQIALAFMEAEAGTTAPASGTEYVQAADIFRLTCTSMTCPSPTWGAHETQALRISWCGLGMANTYLALGDVNRAAAELAAVNSEDSRLRLSVSIGAGAYIQQQHQGVQALTAFAQAASAAGEDQSAQQSLLSAGGNEGYVLNRKWSVLGNLLRAAYV